MRWRRGLRRVAAWLAGPPLVVLAALCGTTLALLYTSPGRAMTIRAATGYLNNRIAGEISIGGFRGSVFRHVVLENVTLADSNGSVLLDAERLEARYFLPELIAGRIVIRELDLERPNIHLARLRRGGWNYEAVFRKGEGGDGGPPPRVEFRNVKIEGGSLQIDAPTSRGAPRRPISRNGAAPNQPDLLETDDGLVRAYLARGLTGRFDLLRFSTPDRDPILIVIDSIATTLNDPAIVITDLAGTISVEGDSLQFTFDRAGMPNTRLVGGGSVRWPEDTLQFDFGFEADTVSLVDLHWIQPDFPDWVGHGRVTALSAGNRRTSYRLDGLVLGNATSRAAGSMIAITDAVRGFGVADLDLVLEGVSLEAMRPYLDTIPFAGNLSGRLRADGYSDRLALEGELDFVDRLVASRPTSHLDFDGALRFGGADGTIFEEFALRSTLLDMATIEVMIPAVTLPGTLRLVGRVDGPWTNVRFEGTGEHLAPNDALSRMTGSVAFDTRGAILGLAMDSRFDRLSFDGLRAGYPELTPRGGVVGRVVTSGRLDSLSIEANLTGDIGEVDATGIIAVTAPRFAFDSLALELRRFDVQALLGRGNNTAINGTGVIWGVTDSGVPPRGQATVSFGQSRFGGITVDGVHGRLGSDGQTIAFDTLDINWPDGNLTASGSLGWTTSDTEGVAVSATIVSLTPLDSLVRAFLGVTPDSSSSTAFDGLAEAHLTVLGSIERPSVTGSIEAERVMLDDWRLGSATVLLAADSLGGDRIEVEATADSLSRGEYQARDLSLRMYRVGDSTRFSASGRLRDARLGVTGMSILSSEGNRTAVDSFGLALPSQQWRLERPFDLTSQGGSLVLDQPIVINTTDGSGTMRFTGSIPGEGVGDLDGSIVGFDLADLYSVVKRDTNSVGGIASVDFRLGGTRNAPLLRGNTMVTGPSFRGVNPPLVRAAFDYGGQLLRSYVTFWKTGQQVLEVDLSVPYDLALVSREQRRLPGGIEIYARADSADLSILEAFTNSLRNTTGSMALELNVTGTWETPRMDGQLAIRKGRTSLPALGVRYSPIDGHATFRGDSMIVDTLLLSSGERDMTVKGSVRFEDLNRPVLDLTLNSAGFLAINAPGFLRLRPTGTVTLTGPFWQPVMRGDEIRVDDSDLFFSDLLNKNVIDLEDPQFKGLVDPTSIREQQLGAAFQNRFLDSLRIENLSFRVGNNVWLRSSEADIQLEGRVQVDKVRRDYRLTGVFNTPRGRYTLQLGPLYRDFAVESGTVRYSGTPDLNADLNVIARHDAPTAFADELPIIATITGSILVPQVALSTTGRQLSERDLVSYMMFGQPESRLGSALNENFAFQTALGALVGEFGRRVVQDWGFGGLDVFEIRPDVSGSGESGSFQRLAAGWNLGSRWFVSLNFGLCLGGDAPNRITAKNFGASIEYRFAREWRAQTSAEPVRTCLGGRLSDAFNTVSRRYQLGADLLWEKEY